MTKVKRRVSSKVEINFLNDHQEKAMEAIESNDITFLIGPAGTAKTFLASAFAVKSLLHNQHRKVYIARPVVETAGESIGFLPGTIEQKLEPYVLPIHEVFDLMFEDDQQELKKQILEKVKIAPIAFIRGRTLSEAVCILDEAQNATLPQLKAWMTRIGRNSKMIITGDPTQSDLPNYRNEIARVADGMRKVKGIAVVDMPASTIVRHPIVESVIQVFEKLEKR